MTLKRFPSRLLALLGGAGLFTLMAAPAPALAGPRAWRQPTYVLVPVEPVRRRRSSRRAQRVYAPRVYRDYVAPVRRRSRVNELRAELERDARRCNTGRLVGGLLGGGAGYLTSQDEGRAWAVPLGTLLGSQVGCNVGTGRGPAPW